MADNSIVEKIQKLLRLAQSSNPNEAALAAAKAQELMVKYAVEEADLAQRQGNKAEPIEVERFNLGYKRIPLWLPILAQAISKSFFCRMFYYKYCGDIAIVGRKTDREIMRATFDYLRYELERMCEKDFAAYSGGAHGKTWKASFYRGACDTISTRLSENMKKLSDDNAGTAIVLVNRAKDVDEYVEENIQTRKSQSVRRKVSAEGYYSGVAAGNKVGLEARATKKLGEGK